MSTAIAAKESPAYRVTLSADGEDRAGQVITFTLPENLRTGAELHSSDGGVLPLQLAPDGTACFTVGHQRAGELLHFILGGNSVSNRSNEVLATRKPDGVELSVSGNTLLFYRTNKEAPIRAGINPVFKRSGYLHPILTPAGYAVSDDSPANHPHHHGLWTAWSMTKFQGRTPNFWELAQAKGTVEFAGLDKTWSGPVHGGFIGRQRMIDLTAPTPIAALDEIWEVTAYRFSSATIPVGMFDLQSTETCATADALELPTYLYGGLGFRGSENWDGEQGLAVLTSEGETERNRANASHCRWCYLGPAKRGAQPAGIVILGHPQNFRAPQPVRIHPSMPFFSFAIPQAGDSSIEPGVPLVLRYRVLTLDAKPDRTLLDAYWRGFAHPASATVSGLPAPTRTPSENIFRLHRPVSNFSLRGGTRPPPPYPPTYEA